MSRRRARALKTLAAAVGFAVGIGLVTGSGNAAMLVFVATLVLPSHLREGLRYNVALRIGLVLLIAADLVSELDMEAGALLAPVAAALVIGGWISWRLTRGKSGARR